MATGSGAELVKSWYFSFLNNNLQENIKTFLWSITALQINLHSSTFSAIRFHIHKYQTNVFKFLFYKNYTYFRVECVAIAVLVPYLWSSHAVFRSGLMDKCFKLHMSYSQSHLHGGKLFFVARDAASYSTAFHLKGAGINTNANTRKTLRERGA